MACREGMVVPCYKGEGCSRFFKQVGELGTMTVTEPDIEKHGIVIALGDLVTGGMDVVRSSRHLIAEFAQETVHQISNNPFILNNEDSRRSND